jgi:predicted nucleotidyltransferase
MAVDIKKITRLARDFAADVKSVLPVDKAILFGSYAKGYATELSDVDICFFMPDYKGKEPYEIIAELLRLGRAFGGKYREVPFEPLVFETVDLQDDTPFIREVLATGVELL